MAKMETTTGQMIDLGEEIDPDQIKTEDIVSGMYGLARFAGQGVQPCWLAGHSLMVADLVTLLRCHGEEPEERLGQRRLAAVLHDAHEVYTGDIIGPLKASLSQGGQDEIKQIQDRVDTAIAARYEFPVELLHAPEVGLADAWALLIEARINLPSEGLGEEWTAPRVAMMERAVEIGLQGTAVLERAMRGEPSVGMLRMRQLIVEQCEGDYREMLRQEIERLPSVPPEPLVRGVSNAIKHDQAESDQIGHPEL